MGTSDPGLGVSSEVLQDLVSTPGFLGLVVQDRYARGFLDLPGQLPVLIIAQCAGGVGYDQQTAARICVLESREVFLKSLASWDMTGSLILIFFSFLRKK